MIARLRLGGAFFDGSRAKILRSPEILQVNLKGVWGGKMLANRYWTDKAHDKVPARLSSSLRV